MSITETDAPSSSLLSTTTTTTTSSTEAATTTAAEVTTTTAAATTTTTTTTAAPDTTTSTTIPATTAAAASSVATTALPTSASTTSATAVTTSPATATVTTSAFIPSASVTTVTSSSSSASSQSSPIATPTAPPSTVTDQPNVTAVPVTTTAAAAGDDDPLLSADEQWLVIAGSIVIGVLIIGILVCAGARWYWSSDKRRERRRQEAEDGLRRREIDADDEVLQPPTMMRDGHAEAEEMEGYEPHDSPTKDLQMAEGRGRGGGSPYSPNGGPRGGRGRGRGGRGGGGAEGPPVVFSEVNDPADVLAPIDPRLLKSLYESDEDEPPLPHQREASWMETDEDRRRRRMRRTRPDKGEARQHFDQYLKANQEELSAQQRAMYDARGRRRVPNGGGGWGGGSSSDSDDPLGLNAKPLPLSRAEAEQMRIEDLNDKMVERHRITEHFKHAHPVYQHQDPIHTTNKALLSTTLYRARIQPDDTVAREREEEREERMMITGNDVPWGNREDAVAMDPVAKLHALPWMTADRVKALAKEHTRSDRKQQRRQKEIEKYVGDDGRIDYDLNRRDGGHHGEGNSDGRAVSDRASSFRGGDRASSIMGGTTRRRGGSPSERMSAYNRGGDGRASAIMRGNFDRASSVGRTVTALRLAELDDNTRNSALTIEDLRAAREAFGGASSYGRGSQGGGTRDGGASSAGDRRSGIWSSPDTADRRSASPRGGGLASSSNRRRARFENDSMWSDRDGGGGGTLGERSTMRSFGGGDYDVRSHDTQSQQGAAGEDDRPDDDDDVLGLGPNGGGLYHGLDATVMSKQALVDARSLSLLKAQLVEARGGAAASAGAGGGELGGDATALSLAEGGGINTGGAAVGVYNNMNVALQAASPNPRDMAASKYTQHRVSPAAASPPRHDGVHEGRRASAAQQHSRDRDGEEDGHDYSNVQPHQWQLKGDEHFFHLSPQPQRRLRRAAEVADAHSVEALTGYAARIDEAEDRYYAERDARRKKMVAARRMAGVEVDEDALSDCSELSVGSQGRDYTAHNPVSVTSDAKGCKVFRAFASPHQDPYLNML